MCGQENLYSLFTIDAYNHNCQLILDRNLKNLNLQIVKIFTSLIITFQKNIENILKIIKKNNFQKDLQFKKKIKKKVLIILSNFTDVRKS